MVFFYLQPKRVINYDAFETDGGGGLQPESSRNFISLPVKESRCFTVQALG